MPSLKQEKDLFVKKLPLNKTKRKTYFAIQATMLSKVFFGKVLIKMPDGRTILEFLVDRIKATEISENIVIVTSDQDSDLAIVEEGQRLGIKVIRGPLDE